MSDGPIVGAELWREVVSAADCRCECTGSCGRSHTDRRRKDAAAADPRCKREQWPTLPLHAIPRGTAQGIAAMMLSAEQLMAVCAQCHEGIERGRNRIRKAQAEARLAAGSEPLFDTAGAS